MFNENKIIGTSFPDLPSGHCAGVSIYLNISVYKHH